MTRAMSIPAILERIAQIDQIVSPKPPASAAAGASAARACSRPRSAGHRAGRSLARSSAAAGARRLPGTGGARALAAAQSQVGVAEQPPGSNDGPADRPVPHRHGGQRRRAVVRLLHLVGRGAGRRPARRGRAGLRLGQRPLRVGAAHRPRHPRRPRRAAPTRATSSSGAAATSASWSPSTPTARSTPSRATPPTPSRGAPTGPTAAAPRATCGSAEPPDTQGAWSCVRPPARRWTTSAAP